jgi:hypothetical protein
VKFGVRAAFEVIVALEFERDVVWPTLGAFHKAIVEGGHSSRRIYTKTRPTGVASVQCEEHSEHTEE